MNTENNKSQKTIVLDWIQNIGTVETRLIEKSTGDFEYFPNGDLLIENLKGKIQLSAANYEQTVISLLRELEKEGKVSNEENVTNNDTSEYHVIWKVLKN